MLADYWQLMPQYQGVDLSSLEVERILFGFFPTYRNSPLAPGFDRVLQVGDASGIQSPLSFGGFGALTRHIGRLTTAVQEAVEVRLSFDKHRSGAGKCVYCDVTTCLCRQTRWSRGAWH